MKRALLLVAAAALLAPATAAAKPTICTKKGLAEVLAARDVDSGEGFNQIRCGDVTGDGRKDAVFTLLSGGTAGPTRFGVVANEGELEILEDGYKITVDIVNDRRFDVQQPIFKRDDANCCPSAFAFTPYRFKDGEFEAGKASKRYKKPKQRFYD